MSTDSENQSTAAFDRQQALEGLGDDLELLSEMAELFLEDIDCLVEEVREAVSTRDASTLRRSAHQLKGSASNFHAASTVETALYPVSSIRTLGRSKLRDTLRGFGPRGESRHEQGTQAIH